MPSINRVIVVGQVTRPPKITNGDKKVANVTISTVERWKSKNTGEIQSRIDYHNIVAFDKVADVVDAQVEEGDVIWVDGPIHYSYVEHECKEEDYDRCYRSEIKATTVMRLYRGKDGHKKETT